jgi:hypothetical protein
MRGFCQALPLAVPVIFKMQGWHRRFCSHPHDNFSGLPSPPNAAILALVSVTSTTPYDFFASTFTNNNPVRHESNDSPLASFESILKTACCLQLRTHQRKADPLDAGTPSTSKFVNSQVSRMVWHCG